MADAWFLDANNLWFPLLVGLGKEGEDRAVNYWESAVGPGSSGRGSLRSYIDFSKLDGVFGRYRRDKSDEREQSKDAEVELHGE